MDIIYIGGQAYSQTFLILYWVTGIIFITGVAFSVEHYCSRSFNAQRSLRLEPPHESPAKESISMSATIRGIAKRLGQQLVWLSMTEEERAEETRRETLAVFHQEWAEKSMLADTRFTDFKERFKDYSLELEKVRKLDAEHEAQSWVKFRCNSVPGLHHYLEETRPHLTVHEMVLVDYYKATQLAWRAMHDALDALFVLKNALYYSKVLERSSIIELYRKREDEYTARKLQLQPVEYQFIQYSYAESNPPDAASPLDKWRAAQNRRRHASK